MSNIDTETRMTSKWMMQPGPCRQSVNFAQEHNPSKSHQNDESSRLTSRRRSTRESSQLSRPWLILSMLVIFCTRASQAEIIKPFGEWLCNYCAMGPREDPEECGTPILCMFYGLLIGVILLTIYSTIKGSTE